MALRSLTWVRQPQGHTEIDPAAVERLSVTAIWSASNHRVVWSRARGWINTEQSSPDFSNPAIAGERYVGPNPIFRGFDTGLTAPELFTETSGTVAFIQSHRTESPSIRQTFGFCTSSATEYFGNRRVGASTPRTGNLLTWEFANNGAAQLVIGGFQQVLRPQPVVLTAGPGFRQAWADGTFLGSNTATDLLDLTGAATMRIVGDQTDTSIDADFSIFVFADRAWTEEEIRDWSDRPWQLYRTAALPIGVQLAGSTLVSSAGLSSQHSIGSSLISLANGLSSASLGHAQAIGSVAASSATSLPAAAFAHAHLLSASNLSTGIGLGAASLASPQAMASATLALRYGLTAAGMSHAQAVAVAALATQSARQPFGMSHANALNATDVIVGQALAGATANHGQTFVVAGVNLAHVLAPQGMLHGHPMSAVEPTTAQWIAAAAALHSHAMGGSALATVPSISVAPFAHQQTFGQSAISTLRTIQAASAAHGHALSVSALSAAGAASLSADAFVHLCALAQAGIITGQTVTPQMFAHANMLAQPLLASMLSIQPIVIGHQNAIGQPVVGVSLLVSPAAFTNDHRLFGGALAIGLSNVSPDNLASAMSISGVPLTTGVQSAVLGSYDFWLVPYRSRVFLVRSNRW